MICIEFKALDVAEVAFTFACVVYSGTMRGGGGGERDRELVKERWRLYSGGQRFSPGHECVSTLPGTAALE